MIAWTYEFDDKKSLMIRAQMGNVWFVMPLLSVNKLINNYSVHDVWVANTSRVG